MAWRSRADALPLTVERRRSRPQVNPRGLSRFSSVPSRVSASACCPGFAILAVPPPGRNPELATIVANYLPHVNLLGSSTGNRSERARRLPGMDARFENLLACAPGGREEEEPDRHPPSRFYDNASIGASRLRFRSPRRRAGAGVLALLAAAATVAAVVAIAAGLLGGNDGNAGSIIVNARTVGSDPLAFDPSRSAAYERAAAFGLQPRSLCKEPGRRRPHGHANHSL